MSTVLADIRYAVRGFAKHPGFTIPAILSLAIGIGANTSVYSVASALLLHPLPYRDADRLVILWNRSPGLNISEDWFSTAQYFDIRNGHFGFEQIAIAIGGNYNLVDSRGEPERVGIIRTSSNLLPMLGARAAIGRLFVADEDAPGHQTAVLSYGTWMRRYGGDRRVIGQQIALNGVACQIVGVLPSSFALPRDVLPTLGVAEEGEIFLPLPLGPGAATNRRNEDYNIIGKLRPGVSVAHAQAEMDTITARLRRDFPDFYPPNGGLTFSIVRLLDQTVGAVRLTLVVLVASVGLVLLIACANVANLLLSRSLARQKEIAVRAALGAGRGRLIRQLLTESVVLALVGGSLGIVFSIAAVKGMRVLQPQSIPRLSDVAINGEVLAFTLVISTFAGLLFGLAPAVGIGRLNLYSTFRDAGASGSVSGVFGGRGGTLRRMLVAGELAMALVLLIGAGLLIRTIARLHTVDPGFSATGVLTLELTMNGPRYSAPTAVLSAYRSLWERLERLPGVTAAGGVTSLPLSGFFAWGPITVEGRVPPPGENFVNADIRTVGGRYFDAMDIPLRRGRFFSDDDGGDHPRVIIIDDYMAAEFWPNQDPIGRRIRFGDRTSTAPWRTVVGVVGRVKQYTLASEGRIAFYVPQTQSPARALYVTVRTKGDPRSIAAAVKREIRELDPTLPLYHVRPMSDWVEQSLARQRFAMRLLALFAALALALATIGIHGVMAYLVSQGTREIGIRMALGASQRAVVRMVVRQGMAMAFGGVAIGLAVAFTLTRFMNSLLFEVPATDPMTFVSVSALLLVTSFVASYFPSRRAARTDPMQSLRSE